jgi:hypothetical protein
MIDPGDHSKRAGDIIVEALADEIVHHIERTEGKFGAWLLKANEAEPATTEEKCRTEELAAYAMRSLLPRPA